jgi:hypothetical protein
VHGCGWDSGAARERSSALAASVASRYALGTEGGGAARPGAYMCPPRNCALRTLSPGGSGDVEDVVCCPLLERLGARRASSSCGGRGWGGTPRGPCCHRLRHARAERRYGGSWQEGRRASGVAASPRSRAAGAPATRRRRAVGGACACRARSNGRRRPSCGGGGAHTNSELPQAGFPPDRGKYC